MCKLVGNTKSYGKLVLVDTSANGLNLHLKYLNNARRRGRNLLGAR